MYKKFLKKKKFLKFTYWQAGSRIENYRTINIFSHPNITLNVPMKHSALKMFPKTPPKTVTNTHNCDTDVIDYPY